MKARPPRTLASISAASAALRFSMAVRRRRRAAGVPLTTTRRGPLIAATVAASSASETSATSSSTSASVGAADGEHGGVLAVRHQAGAAADDGGCGADEAGDRHQLDVAGASSPSASRRPAKAATPRMPCEWPTEATGRDRGEVQALGREQVDGGELGEQHAGHAESGADRVGAGGGPRRRSSHTCGSKGRGSAAASWPATGATRRPDSSTRWLTRAVSVFSPASSRRVANQSAPCPPKVTANSSPSGKPVRQGQAPLGGRVVMGQRGGG